MKLWGESPLYVNPVNVFNTLTKVLAEGKSIFVNPNKPKHQMQKAGEYITPPIPLKFIDNSDAIWSFKAAFQQTYQNSHAFCLRIIYTCYFAHNLLFYHARVHEKVSGIKVI